MSRPKNKFSFASALGWFSGRRSGRAARVFEKSDMGVWAETLNPLRGLTAQRAADIFDRARRGVYAELAWLYQEIEASDPNLFVCTERRESAAGACDWRVSLANPERTAGFEESLAKEQQDFLSAAFGRAGDEIGALAEHLGRGFFRGFAHARPVWEADGISGFEFFDQWNFARDPATGQWWWNPDASFTANDNFAEIPEGELVTLERSRHIDYPALLISVRAALGEKKWGVLLERFGIPPVTIIMPEFADKTEEPAYMAAAESLAKAGSGALPFGSQVNYATAPGGFEPFSNFLRHQQELTVLLATGGLLTTLTAPGSGTLAGEAHLNTWREVVARDIRAVARAVNRTVTRRLLAARFPGRPILALFEFDPDPAPSADEIFETAAKAKAAGYLVAQADLEERTGFSLVKDESAPAQGFQPAFAGASAPAASPAAAGAPAEASVADTAMNGAQVTALLDIISKVHSGEIDKAAAPAIVKSAFPLLSEEQIAAMMPPVSGAKGHSLANKDAAGPATPLQTPLQAIAKRGEAPAGPLNPAAPALNKRNPVAKALQIAPDAPDAQPAGEETPEATPPENAKKTPVPAKRPDPVEAALQAPDAAPALEAILEAFRADLGPAAEKVAALLAMPPERRAAAAGELAAALPGLLPGDPEAAAALEEALAGTFAAELDAAAAAGKDGK